MICCAHWMVERDVTECAFVNGLFFFRPLLQLSHGSFPLCKHGFFFF